MKSSLDKFGRVLIPKRFRDGLGLEPGDTLDVVESDQGIYLKPERGGGELSVREGVLVYMAETSGHLDRALEETRKNRLDKLGLSA